MSVKESAVHYKIPLDGCMDEGMNGIVYVVIVVAIVAVVVVIISSVGVVVRW